MSKKNWLDKGKSYLKEIQIESVKSKYSKGLAVSMIKGRYQLYTDKVIYSYEDLYKNFRVTCNKINWEIFKPKTVLVLGLGLGSVIQLIEKKNKHPLIITAVDIDESTFYLTQKYTASKFKSPVEYIHADAGSFVTLTKRKFDLIVFDIFIDDTIPAQFQTLPFIKKLHHRLNPNGMLWINRIAQEPAQIMEAMQFMESVFKKVWPEAGFIDVPPNWILVSDMRLIKK